MHSLVGFPLLGILSLSAATAFATIGVKNDPCKVIVPTELLPQMKAMKSPLPSSAAIVTEGKAIYEGKGACFTCHGLSGKGNGDAGKALDPAPRNFTNPKFHECKSDGEMFWVIAYGSHGTGMLPAIKRDTIITDVIITEEEAWKLIQYERSFKAK